MKTGVPQGSVLGLLLFLIMIADTDSGLQHGQATLFADDMRVKKKVGMEEDVAQLQDMNLLLDWPEKQHENELLQI